MPEMKICPACQGTGEEVVYVHGTYLIEKCQVCHGRGLVHKSSYKCLWVVIIVIIVSWLIRKSF